jgi:hypothetical protein
MRDPGQYPAGRDSADPAVLRYGSWAEMPVVPLTRGPKGLRKQVALFGRSFPLETRPDLLQPSRRG